MLLFNSVGNEEMLTSKISWTLTSAKLLARPFFKAKLWWYMPELWVDLCHGIWIICLYF